MTLKAIIMRAEGGFAEIEDARRQAFVSAFQEAGYDWPIDRNAFAGACRLGSVHDRMTFFVQTHLKSGANPADVKKLTDALYRRAGKVFSAMIRSGAIEPRVGVRELVVAARKEGIRLALISTMSEGDVNQMLIQTLGSRGTQLFENITLMDEEEANAAPERLYENLAAEFGVAPQNCLVIDSTLGGMMAARAVGYPAICTRSSFCTESAAAMDSAGFYEDLPSILARSTERRGEPLSSEERNDLFAAFQQLCCGNFANNQTTSTGQPMRVCDILKVKGSAVKTVEPTSTMRAFAKALRTEGVGAMVVQEKDGRLCGIITERDLARGLAEFGDDLPSLPVSAMMTKEIVSCAPEDTVASAAKVMTQRRIRHLPVVVGTSLAGLISIGDVLKYRLDEVQLEASVLREVARARR